MLKKIVMSFAMFSATYLLLSVRVSGVPLFTHLYRLTSPATLAVQAWIENVGGKGWQGSRRVGHSLFHNSLPTTHGRSQNLHRTSLQVGSGIPQENLGETEKRELDNLIKNYAR